MNIHATFFKPILCLAAGNINEGPSKLPKDAFAGKTRSITPDPSDNECEDVVQVRPSKKRSPPLPPVNVPTEADPMDEPWVGNLYTEKDKGTIKPAQILIRRDVLEVRRTESGKIFFQCGCCSHRPRTSRKVLSTVSPTSVGGIYRAVMHFMKHHVPACDDIPQDIKAGVAIKDTKDIKTREIKKYWTESATVKGLRDASDRESIDCRHQEMAN